MTQQPEDICEQRIPISESIEDKKKLTRLVTACYEALNVYGKTPEQLEGCIMLMQMTLGRFDYELVRAAFGLYLQSGSTMPTPADIIKIIEPPVEEKKWCKVTFLEIKRKRRENQFTSLAEDKYCEDFIRAQVTAKSDDKGMFLEAIKQAELENKQYWLEG